MYLWPYRPLPGRKFNNRLSSHSSSQVVSLPYSCRPSRRSTGTAQQYTVAPNPPGPPADGEVAKKHAIKSTAAERSTKQTNCPTDQSRAPVPKTVWHSLSLEPWPRFLFSFLTTNFDPVQPNPILSHRLHPRATLGPHPRVERAAFSLPFIHFFLAPQLGAATDWTPLGTRIRI